MSKNRNLHNAAKAKEDEFYTKITDIEKELKHYKEHFKEKVVFCNCDDPETSNFWRYFELNFDFLELEKLVSTHYEIEKPSYKLEKIRGVKEVIKTPLQQNGDFRSPECIEILKECDIVVTNPPFSLFREYVGQLVEYNKKFLIIGNMNAITYKEIFPLIMNEVIWLGYKNGDMEFVVPDYYEPRETRYREEDGVKYRSMGNICWYTNLDIKKRHEDLILYKTYTPEEYPTYDEYDIINVNKVAEIPFDYNGIMGVPITYVDKHNPAQFEILGVANSARWIGHECFTLIDGKKIYNRVLIKSKR